jgi:hypothetical protein
MVVAAKQHSANFGALASSTVPLGKQAGVGENPTDDGVPVSGNLAAHGMAQPTL